MQSYGKILRSWLAAYAQQQRQRFDRKTFYLGLGLIAFTLFSDTILHAVGHFLHVGYELTASMLEHMLEATFHLSREQVQIIVFYGGFILGLGWLWFFAWKFYQWLLALYQDARMRWELQPRAAKFATLLRFTLILSSVLTSWYFFS